MLQISTRLLLLFEELILPIICDRKKKKSLRLEKEKTVCKILGPNQSLFLVGPVKDAWIVMKAGARITSNLDN
jgi:hypothetical protein